MSTEVYDGDGNPDGYWCLVEGSFTQTNQPTYHNIPVGVRAGCAQWYGFAIMLLGATVVGGGLLRGRSAPTYEAASDGHDGDASEQ